LKVWFKTVDKIRVENGSFEVLSMVEL